MTLRSVAVALVSIPALLAVAVSAQGQSPIRLRARSFVPPANLHGRQGTTERRSSASRSVAQPARRHLLIQFDGPVTAADLAALRAAGASPLRYVPENTVAVAAGPAFDPAAVPRARWSGELEAGDRLSARSARDLARRFPAYPLTIVEFHPDADAAFVSERLAAAGTARAGRTALPPYMAAIPSDRLPIERLSADTSVAWIFPATTEVMAGGALICEGQLSPQGLVASYATVGEGWDGGGPGSARLSYFLQNGSADLAVAPQHAEVVRALTEWSRHADVDWKPAGSATEAQSATVLWGPLDHGDGFPFAPNVLAHAFFPAPPADEPYAGDIHFNDTYDWGIGDPGRYDVFSVALHEAGHSLGLAHSTDPATVMYPVYSGIVQGPAGGDIEALQTLYAGRDPLPPGWQNATVGEQIGGTVSEAEGAFTITAGGRDVWGTADELRFASRTLIGDGDITARLDSLQAPHRWTKAGVMIRESADSSAAHAFLLVSGARGIAFQRRPAAGAESVHTDGGAGTAPRWLWLSRRGMRVSAYVAGDGEPWRLIGADTITMGAEARIGLAVSSHADTTATAVFSQVSVAPVTGWLHADVGAVGVKGWVRAMPAGIRIAGAGEDVWDAADAFHFAWVPLAGDGEITARVSSLAAVRAWSKAGVMIRESLDPGAPHAFMLVSGSKGAAFQRRSEHAGVSDSTPGGAAIAPLWVRLQRRGQVVSAYRSDDGLAWTVVGSATIVMGERVLAGLAVSSHTSTATSPAVFERVTVR